MLEAQICEHLKTAVHSVQYLLIGPRIVFSSINTFQDLTLEHFEVIDVYIHAFRIYLK